MTLRIEEPYTPEYWYVLLVGCNLDANCSWIPSAGDISVNYDIWLTNGSPLLQYLNPFTHQFSFDEQVGVSFSNVFTSSCFVLTFSPSVSFPFIISTLDYY